MTFWQVEEAAEIFEDVDADEYDRRQEARRDDDFIVDDEGYGYKDQGGEIWDLPEDGGQPGTKKRRKRAKDEQ